MQYYFESAVYSHLVENRHLQSNTAKTNPQLIDEEVRYHRGFSKSGFLNTYQMKFVIILKPVSVLKKLIYNY